MRLWQAMWLTITAALETSHLAALHASIVCKQKGVKSSWSIRAYTVKPQPQATTRLTKSGRANIVRMNISRTTKLMLIKVLDDPTGRPWLALDSCLEHGVLPPIASLLFTTVSMVPAYVFDSSYINSTGPILGFAWVPSKNVNRHPRWSASPDGKQRRSIVLCGYFMLDLPYSLASNKQCRNHKRQLSTDLVVLMHVLSDRKSCRACFPY